MMQPLEAEDPRIAGEFRLRARLGAGGMGRVYLGYSPAGRAVAVKICHPEFAADPAFVRRFALEVAAARAVNGLYTAQVIDAGPDDDPPWLATSYVPGPSLYDAVTGYGPLPGPAVWRLAAGLAEALQAVHARGLVHRDLKPTNVLLAADGPRVIDFGIARALDGTSLTATGIEFGTPSYMSPEQAEGRPAIPASDVFALGGVLCFAATGAVPFGDGDPPAVLYRVVHAPPALEAVPGPMRDLVSACLAKNPADRPTLPQLLRACQADDPLSGSFWPGQVAALIARHRAGVDAAAAAAEPDGEPTRGVAGQLAAPPRTWPTAAPDSTPRPRPHAAPRGVGRRRALAGLAGLSVAGLSVAGLSVAGLSVAGLATAGWELTRLGRGPGRDRAAARLTPGQPLGRLRWVGPTGGPVSSGAAIAGGVAYIGASDGQIYAFDAASGLPSRTFRTGGAVSGAVTVAGRGLFAGSADHLVYARPVGPGGPSWTFRTGGPVSGRPAVAHGVVFVGSDDHCVYAIHAGSGRRIWRYRTGGPVRSGPLPGRSPYQTLVFAGSDDGHLYALDAGTGRLKWRFATGGAVGSGPMQDSLAGIYAGSDDGYLYSLYADSGQKAWRFRARGAVRGTPVSAGSTVYIGSAGSAVYAVSTAGGNPIWSYRTSGPVRSGPALAGSVLYVGDDDGYLYAIDITSTSPRWRYQAGGPVRSQILYADGVVYFGSLDGHVYALRA
jgi:outer membrane protein assembly factor BamB